MQPTNFHYRSLVKADKRYIGADDLYNSTTKQYESVVVTISHAELGEVIDQSGKNMKLITLIYNFAKFSMRYSNLAKL